MGAEDFFIVMSYLKQVRKVCCVIDTGCSGFTVVCATRIDQWCFYLKGAELVKL